MAHSTTRLPVSTLASGFELGLTIHDVTSGRPGPRVGISAMIHGDELDGWLIIREFLRAMDEGLLRGSLRLLPVANPLGMEAIARNTPTDTLDMNRLFPGAPDGWLSEQLAHVITTGFLDTIDVLIDIHAGGTFPWVDYCYVGNDLELSRAFLPAVLYRPSSWYPGTSASHAIARGIPTTVIEIGGGYRDQAGHIANGLRGLRNMLRHLGVMAGDVEHRPRQLLLTEMKVMRPQQGGVCVPRGRLVPGEWLEAGHVLADIVSPYTFDVLETMVAPWQRNVVVLTRNYATRIHPGDYGFMIGNGDSATWLD
ncbi:MAG: succinylglutamate desuccinylase/aspartoacylase family protein [Gemmatimonadaceae bacterium]|nr:succinylglutamate desuccinylase/aspartoacylase family protein [Gemmatimonadaceae bacterium]